MSLDLLVSESVNENIALLRKRMPILRKNTPVLANF